MGVRVWRVAALIVPISMMGARCHSALGNSHILSLNRADNATQNNPLSSPVLEITLSKRRVASYWDNALHAVS